MYMVILEKDGDLTLPKNFRGISMAELSAKLYAHLLKGRLEIDYEEIAPEYANGFRPGRSRGDSIMTMKETLRKRKASGLDSYAIFWDAIKCFDKIPRKHLWRAMGKCGVDTELIQAVQSTLEMTTCTLKIGDETRQINMKEGTGQGTVLGPTLCSFFFLPVLELWCKDKAKCHTQMTVKEENEKRQTEISTFVNSFADDTGMITGTYEDTVEIVSQFPAYMESFGVPVHLAEGVGEKSKSTVVYVPTNSKNLKRFDSCSILVNQIKKVNFVQSCRYLGAIIHESLSDEMEITQRIGKAVGMMGILRKSVMASKDVKMEVKRKIMLGLIIPILLDGAENWVLTAKMTNGITTAYNSMIRSCFRMNRFTTWKYKITTESLLQKMDMFSLQYYLDWKILGYAGHVERMSPNRIPKQIRDASTYGTKKIGGQSKSYERQLQECLKRKGIPVELWKSMAMSKCVWRKAIRKKSIPVVTRHLYRHVEKKEYCTNPDKLVGCFVEKRFGQTWHVGKVINYEECDTKGDIIWRVIFDDDDMEDYCYDEIEKILCLDLEFIL